MGVLDRRREGGTGERLEDTEKNIENEEFRLKTQDSVVDYVNRVSKVKQLLGQTRSVVQIGEYLHPISPGETNGDFR